MSFSLPGRNWQETVGSKAGDRRLRRLNTMHSHASAIFDAPVKQTVFRVCARAYLVLFATLAAMAVGTSADGGSAVSVSGPRKFTIDIPAQPLANALQAFSGVTGIETLYDGTVARERTSTAVMGTFTAFEALRLLLAGTSLSARAIAQDAVTIGHPQASADEPMAPAPERSPHRLYFGVIQQGLERALCEEDQLRPGRYRAVLKFTIGADGQIRQLSLIGTTGDEERDRIIARKLGRVSLGIPPPADLQQPIMIVVLPRSYDAAQNCASLH